MAANGTLSDAVEGMLVVLGWTVACVGEGSFVAVGGIGVPTAVCVGGTVGEGGGAGEQAASKIAK